MADHDVMHEDEDTPEKKCPLGSTAEAETKK